MPPLTQVPDAPGQSALEIGAKIPTIAQPGRKGRPFPEHFMPIYAFECGACGHRFDRLQRLADADPVECPECAQAQIRRQLTAPQFRLAGGGWYETDFKKDGDKKRNLADSGDASKSDAKPAEGKPETPAAPKAASKPDSKPTAAPASEA
jgi:putative FmdB family regulatory protein